MLYESSSLQDSHPCWDLRVYSSFRQNEPGRDIAVPNGQAEQWARLKTHVWIDTGSSAPTVSPWRSSPAAPRASDGCTGGEEELGGSKYLS